MLVKSPVSVLVVYASQQGNAQAIAEDLHEELQEHMKKQSVSLRLECMSKLGKEPSLIAMCDCAVFIAATTGDGDPPDTAKKIWRILNKSKQARSEKLCSDNHANTDQRSDEAREPPHNEESSSAAPSNATEASSSTVITGGSAGQTPDVNVGNEGAAVATPTIGLNRDQSSVHAENSSPDSNKSKKPFPATSNKASNGTKLLDGKIDDVKVDLSQLTYTVLGLGDTNYTNFCNFGKNLDDILRQLGAQRFYACGWADDGTGLEIVIEPWKEKFWDAISEHVKELAKKKQEQASKTLPGHEDDVDSNAIRFINDENKQFSTQIIENDECDFGIKEKNDNDVMETKLLNLHLDDLKFWRQNHPLLRLELSPETKLTLPKIPTLDTILIDFEKTNVDHANDSYGSNAFLPSAKSEVCSCEVVEFRRLSHDLPNKPVKKVVEIVLQWPEDLLDYEPGDSIGVLAHNHQRDVDLVLSRLSHHPDEICLLAKNASSKKQIPQHLPTKSSLRKIFTTYVDVRCIPKKALLLQLLSCCTDPEETRCLQELVSREGSEFYLKKILGEQITFIDLLYVFRSCRLKVQSLLEVLPRLLPRAYSLTSSPLRNSKELSFAYSLATIPKSGARFEKRKGVCTGLFDMLQNNHSEGTVTIPKLDLYLRSTRSFRLTEDYTKPIIMIGPGTGVAPFIGFLRHRKLQLDLKLIDSSRVGDSWLFFGCRYKNADELFADEIQEFVSLHVLTNFHSCYSRERFVSEGARKEPKYVQDLLMSHSKHLASAIIEKDAAVYVCGDATNMAKDVYSSFSSILSDHFGDEQEASGYLSQMQKDKRYLQDVWT